MSYNCDIGVVLKEKDLERLVQIIKEEQTVNIHCPFENAKFYKKHDYCVMICESVNSYSTFYKKFEENFFNEDTPYLLYLIGESYDDIKITFDNLTDEEKDEMQECLSLERKIIFLPEDNQIYI